MRFDFNDEQREIKDTARSFLADRFKPEVVRELAEKGTYDADLCRQIRELGWTGIAIDEAHGGQGLGVVELATLCEQLGYVAAPVPFLANAMAGLVIEAAGSEEQKERWLGGIASGEERGALGVVAGGRSLVADADDAAVIVLLDGESASLIERGDASVEAADVIDATRRYAWVEASEGEPLPGDAAGALDRAAVALAAELVGVAQRAMDMAVDYAKERHQFERPIGAYQAVSHLCAQMLFDIEEARSLTYGAAWAADAAPDELPLAAAMALARAADAAWSVTKSSIQVHGGIGFTWEHDLHFLLKRARVAGQLLGTAGTHRERVAELAGLS